MARLMVNVGEGLIEIEGEESFILSAFTEVRDALKQIESPAGAKPKAPSPADAAQTIPEPHASKTQPKAKAAGAKASGGQKKTQPSLNSALNLSGLPEFVQKYKPKNNPEKILVFGSFLRDELNLVKISEDDIYSCFHSMKHEMKIPQAFSKNMNDTKKEGYIAYEKLDDVSITIMGENHLTAMSKKAAES